MFHPLPWTVRRTDAIHDGGRATIGPTTWVTAMPASNATGIDAYVAPARVSSRMVASHQSGRNAPRHVMDAIAPTMANAPMRGNNGSAVPSPKNASFVRDSLRLWVLKTVPPVALAATNGASPWVAATLAHHGAVRMAVPTPMASDAYTPNRCRPKKRSMSAALKATNGAVPRWLRTVSDAKAVAHAT